MSVSQITWYEFQLMGKAGYTQNTFASLQREAQDSYMTYEEILQVEYNKLKKNRERKARFR